MDKLKCLGFAEPEHSPGASGADSLGFEIRHGFGSREGSPFVSPLVTATGRLYPALSQWGHDIRRRLPA
jgi:hypothetical protein